MQKLILLSTLALAIVNFSAHATPAHVNAQAVAGAIALSGSSSEAAGGYVNVDNDTRMPASPAIAPSVGTSNKCLIATPSSAAVSILFGGISKTTGFHYSGLCLAVEMGDMALAEKIMCVEDKNYAKLNPKCGK